MCAPARAARSSSRAIPSIPVNQGKLCSRGQAALQGLYNPGRIRAPMARNADGTFAAITWDDAIGRLAAKLGPAGGKLAVVSGAGPGKLRRPACGMDRRRSAGDWSAGSRSTTSRCARPTARCSDSTNCPRTTSPAPSTSCRSAPTFSRPGSRRPRTSAASRTRTDSPRATWPSSSTPARGWTSLVSMPTNGSPSGPGTEAALALAIAGVVAANRGAPEAAQLAKFTPAAAAQETGIPAERIERIAQGVRRRQAEPRGRGWHQRPACRRGRALRGGQPAQLRGR